MVTVFFNHTAARTHAHTHTSSQYTRARAPVKSSPTHSSLRSQPGATSTHSFANDSISWFHSFHCCQTPSISPFLWSQQSSGGAQETGRRRRGLKHPGGSKTPRLFNRSCSPKKYNVFDHAFQRVCMCARNESAKRRGLEK